MKLSASLSHVRQLCSLPLPSEAVMPAVLRSVRRLVGCDSAGFFWVDERGDMTHMYAEKMLPAEVTSRYFRAHYDAVGGFRERLLAQHQAGAAVRETCVTDAQMASPFYREILEPLNAHRILHAVVSRRDAPIGQMSLYRARSDPAFSPQECAAVERIVRYLAHLAAGTDAAAGLAPAEYRDSGQAALLIAAPDGRVRQASGRGHAMLAQASGCRVNRATIVGPLERAGVELLRRLFAAPVPRDIDVGGATASLTVTNEWGRFRLRAYSVGEDFGVLIERQEHLLIRLLDAMRDLSLSAQQREAALLVAQGKTNSEIAAAMGVTLNTAAYHVKQLFAKLDAHDRNEAIARILAAGAAQRS